MAQQFAALTISATAFLAAPASSPGETGFALRWSADGQQLRAADADVLDVVGDLTIEAWVKADYGILDKLFDHIVSKQATDSGYALLTIGTEDFNVLRFAARDHADYDLPYPMFVDRWVHLAGVREGETLRLYLDGEPIVETPSEIPPAANTSPLRIGSSPFGRDTGWIGTIDEVRIWSIARQQQQIAAYKNRQLSGRENGLVANWRMDEGVGDFTFDLTGNTEPAMLGAEEGPDSDDPRWVPGVVLAPPCHADLNSNGVVDFHDVLAVLSSWGPCDECHEDLDQNGVVGFSDLLAVLAAWGPCP